MRLVLGCYKLQPNYSTANTTEFLSTVTFHALVCITIMMLLATDLNGKIFLNFSSRDSRSFILFLVSASQCIDHYLGPGADL